MKCMTIYIILLKPFSTNDVGNYIDGPEFLQLKESDIKLLVPPIGLHRKILRVLQDVQVKKTNMIVPGL